MQSLILWVVCFSKSWT